MGIEIAAVIVLTLVLLGLILGQSRKKKEDAPPSMDYIDSDQEITGKRCPLCKSVLIPGEKVRSQLYRGKPDGIMHIHGCPFCDPKDPEAKIRRYCPYCHDELSKEDYAIARVFEKPGKTQVHILGCTRCRAGSSQN